MTRSNDARINSKRRARKREETYGSVVFGHESPDFVYTSRQGLRFMLEANGWPSSKINRYMYLLEEDSKLEEPKGIPSPALFERS